MLHGVEDDVPAGADELGVDVGHVEDGLHDEQVLGGDVERVGSGQVQGRADGD